MRFVFACFFVVLCCISGLLSAQQIEVYLRNCSFLDPATSPYLETSILIPGNTINYQLNERGNYSAGVEVSLVVKQDEEIKAFEKYVLNSQEISDTAMRIMSMIDLVRFPLAAGSYILSGTFTDIYDANNSARYEGKVVLTNNPEQLMFSDISLIDQYSKTTEPTRYSKHGMDLVPYVHNFYPSEVQQLSFFVELYHSDAAFGEDPFLLSYFVESMNGTRIDHLAGYKKMKPAPVNAFFRSLGINALPTGNYYLVLEARNRQNQLIRSKKLFFQRSNKHFAQQIVLDPEFVHTSFVDDIPDDKITMYLESLVPIADQNETSTILSLVKAEDLEAIRRYFLSFWLTRHHNNAEQYWVDYKAEVEQVNYLYATTIEHGFETPRGYVRLKYGKPNEIHANNESGSKEYEIWHFYALKGGQTNVRFVFVNPTLIPNHFELIHSTAIGEVNDPNWRQQIYQDFNGGNDRDNPFFRDHFGSDVDDAYDGF